MDWSQAVNNYCERTDATFWSEPLNALSNAAFLIAAALCWKPTAGDRGARLLVFILGAIGVGSFLFHTYAEVWAMVADVVPIRIFILAALHLATVRFFAAPWWVGLLAAAAFVPASMALSGAIVRVFGPLNGSAGYMPVVLLLAGYALALRGRARRTALGLGAVAGLLVVSLILRTIDAGICVAVPVGTHFLWHILNAGLLALMIRLVAAHRPPGTSRRA